MESGDYRETWVGWVGGLQRDLNAQCVTQTQCGIHLAPPSARRYTCTRKLQQHATRCSNTCTHTTRCTNTCTQQDVKVLAHALQDVQNSQSLIWSQLKSADLDKCREQPQTACWLQMVLQNHQHTYRSLYIHQFAFTSLHSPLHIHLFTYTTFCTTLCMHTLFSTDKHTHYTLQKVQQQRIYQ